MNNREDELKSLFLQALNNNQEAYKTVLGEVSELLKVYLKNLMSPKMRSKERVEDLVQEVLISIHRKRDLYAADRAFLPWVYAIAKYRLIDSIRAETRGPEFVEWVENLDTREYVFVSQTLSEEDNMELMASLTQTQREILTMAKVDEIPIKDIAKHFNMSVSAVKVTIHRVLKNLRAQL